MLGIIPMCQSHPFLYDGKKSNNHKIVVTEVLQTSNYTYLHGKENDSEKWLAVPTMEANIGGTYSYSGGLPMTQFTSKELKRTFDVVYFLGGVTEEGANKSDSIGAASHHGDGPVYKRTVTQEVKKEIKIDIPKDCITIADLFSKKESYEGKTVKIKGQVTKFNAQIMYKNWIHLQDGTDYNGKFDLIITTAKEVKVGDTVTLEGIISLNKDFGYGYNFDIMMENAVLK